MRRLISTSKYFAGLCVIALLFAGCSTPKRLASLNDDVDELLTSAQQVAFPGSEPETIRLQEVDPEAAKAEYPSYLKLNLRETLRMAAQNNRSYQNARETLFSSALSLRRVLHEWEWNPTNNFSAIFGIDQQPPFSTLSTNSSLGFSKKFAAGGRLAGKLATSTLRYFSGDKSLSISSLASLTLTQPLLQGFNTTVARENLTQAERNLIYALRTYARSRQNLQISIARKYYAVLNAEDALDIARKSYASFQSSLERSEAMADANRVNQFEVDQARQKVLTAETTLVGREEDLETAKDQLKLALALPLDTDLEVERDDLDRLLEITLPKPPMTLEEAVEIALKQRLDYATLRDGIEDARRAVTIAEDAMKTRLDLTLDAQAASKAKNRLSSIRALSADYSAQIDLNLPFDRLDETIALRRAIISYQQALRNCEDAHDELVLELRLTWKQLETYAKNITIQKNSVELAKRRVENTQLLFEGGRIEIR
ncbi:MAG: TolC family protein, partial [Lentisphaeria bacterium]|nr:TolC family protein [Lentisphaeria bacterium]